jgi:hypothetical protein
MEENLDRVWKQFGKNTNAGKLLYDLYGVKFKPEQHISYPDLKKNKSIKNYNGNGPIISNIDPNKRAKSSVRERMQRIEYPELQRKYTSKYSKIDFIPKRKNEKIILQEIEADKIQIMNNNKMKRNFTNSRKYEIEKLQDNFEFQERKIMPKGARLPGIKTDRQIEVVKIEEEQEEPINIKNYRKAGFSKNEELQFLYNSIMKEIDERYSHMEDMKKMGKSIDERIMGEIRERLDELKQLKNMMKD